MAEPPPPHREPLLALDLDEKGQESNAMDTVEHTDVLRGVFPTFCLDVLCKRGFALRDRITDCLGFIADPDAVKTGALMDIRMLWGCFWPVAGIGRFERESAECWSVERRLKFIAVSVRSRRWPRASSTAIDQPISHQAVPGEPRQPPAPRRLVPPPGPAHSLSKSPVLSRQ